jgi:hypothetical protein
MLRQVLRENFRITGDAAQLKQLSLWRNNETPPEIC